MAQCVCMCVFAFPPHHIASAVVDLARPVYMRVEFIGQYKIS